MLKMSGQSLWLSLTLSPSLSVSLMLSKFTYEVLLRLVAALLNYVTFCRSEVLFILMPTALVQNRKLPSICVLILFKSW